MRWLWDLVQTFRTVFFLHSITYNTSLLFSGNILFGALKDKLPLVCQESFLHLIIIFYFILNAGLVSFAWHHAEAGSAE